MRLVSGVAICVGLVLGAAASVARSQVGGPSPEITRSDDLPSVAAVVQRAMERARAQDEAGTVLQYESRMVSRTDSLDGDGEVKETNVEIYRRYPLEGFIYEELVERNDQPLTADETREEHEKREEWVREVRDKTAKGEEYETDDERSVKFDDELMARYQAEVTGTVIVNGESTWVVDFEPREGKLPERTRMDKALNRSTGRLYISQQDYGIPRIEFEMGHPVKYMWGLLATLRRAEGEFNFERVDGDVWLPTSFDLAIELRVFFRTMRRRVNREWVSRHRLDDTATLQ